jgi:hypothetical protein
MAVGEVLARILGKWRESLTNAVPAVEFNFFNSAGYRLFSLRSEVFLFNSIPHAHRRGTQARHARPAGRACVPRYVVLVTHPRYSILTGRHPAAAVAAE